MLPNNFSARCEFPQVLEGLMHSFETHQASYHLSKQKVS